jgi:hypothetical protein
MSPHDDDDDRPRRRRDWDNDGDDRPRRRRDRDDSDDRSYGDERDDFDDLPPRKRGKSGDGLGIASMIVGICAIVVGVVGWCCCGYFGSGASILMGIVAVILGFIGRSQGSRSGMGLTGLILGFASIAIGVLMTILLVVGIAWMQANQGRFAPAGNQNMNNPKRF